MLKLLQRFILSLSLISSLSTLADDAVTKDYLNGASTVPSFFRQLGGNELMYGSYHGENNKMVNEKVYFTVEHHYKSNYRLTDINKILHPSSGRLPDFFKDPTTIKSMGTSKYKVAMEINALVDTLNVHGILSYDMTKQGNKTTHRYSFNQFNMLFTNIVIAIEIVENSSRNDINIYQIAALKKSAYRKLEKIPFGAGTSRLKKTINGSVSRFQKGIGGY